MTDTGTPDGTDLSDRDRAFVDHYLAHGNAAQAARAAGASPRAAARLLGHPPIVAEIARRQAAVADDAPSAAVSLDSLIDSARAAYKVAEQSGNAAAMVAATQLLARLTGRMDGDAPELDKPQSELVSVHDIACAVLALFRAVKLEPGGPTIGVARPGETLVRVSDPSLAEAIGAEPALSPAEFLDTPAEPVGERTQFEPGESEALSNGSWIEFTELPTGGGRHPVLRWGIYGSDGTHLGWRRSRADAIAVAQSLPTPMHPKQETQNG